MPRLKLVASINAPQGKVFEHVTDCGKDGPIDRDAFQKKHGEIESRENNVITTREKDDDLRWKYTFDHPNSRMMEALGSSWADRTDTFESTENSTRWTVQWRTKTAGLQGLIQFLYFQLRGKKTFYRRVIQPVEEYFN